MPLDAIKTDSSEGSDMHQIERNEFIFKADEGTEVSLLLKNMEKYGHFGLCRK